jgi:hypothetical protein
MTPEAMTEQRPDRGVCVRRLKKVPELFSDVNSVAVGTPVARHPPHGSVREELPHTALTSGITIGPWASRTPRNPLPRFPGSVSGATKVRRIETSTRLAFVRSNKRNDPLGKPGALK